MKKYREDLIREIKKAERKMESKEDPDVRWWSGYHFGIQEALDWFNENAEQFSWLEDLNTIQLECLAIAVPKMLSAKKGEVSPPWPMPEVSKSAFEIGKQAHKKYENMVPGIVTVLQKIKEDRVKATITATEKDPVNHTHKAKELVIRYFKMAGLPIKHARRVESIGAIVDHIIAAAVEEALKSVTVAVRSMGK